MTVSEGATADQSLTGSDPDGDALTFSLVSGPAYAGVTTASATTGNLHLAPGFTDAGTYGATVRVSDGSLGDSKSLTVTVTNVDRAPALSQPSDMTVSEGATADQAITGSDPDGDALTFSLVSGPAYAGVTTANGTTGNLHLAPGFTDAGTYGATVRASDGSLSDSKSLTVTVTNVNRAPALSQPSDMTVSEGATADQAITGSDPDGDALTFSLVSGPGYAAVTTVNGTTGNLHLAPGFTDAGTYGATVRASDGSLSDSKSLTVTVNNVDRAPALNAIANMAVAAGATADQAISATDPDGDAITFTSSGPAFMTVTANIQVGTTETGSIHLAPALGTSGTIPASVTATANAAISAQSFTITVTPTNRAPTLSQPSDMTVSEGATADQSITGSDPDGDALTFSLVSGPAYAGVTTASATTGNLHLAPGFTDAGTYGATVRVSDGSLGDSKSLTVTVTNVDRAPALSQPSDMTVSEGATADQAITGSDPDGDALMFSLVSGPGYAAVTTVNGTTGNLHLAPGFTDAGTYGATVRASDGSLSDSKSLTVTVNNVDRAPALNAIANMAVAAGATADQAISATDPDGDAITFTSSGPAFMTVTANIQVGTTETGSIHLAPALGTSGTIPASVTATANAAISAQSFTITVTPTNRAPTLSQPSDMTVSEGATADQSLTGSDPDGDALTFTRAAGPVFFTVSTTDATHGNIHLAPRSGDAAGSPYAASASASDGAL